MVFLFSMARHSKISCIVEFSENQGHSRVVESGVRDTAEPSARACHQPKSVYSNIPWAIPWWSVAFLFTYRNSIWIVPSGANVVSIVGWSRLVAENPMVHVPRALTHHFLKSRHFDSFLHLRRSLLYQQQLTPPKKKSWKVENDGENVICIMYIYIYILSNWIPYIIPELINGFWGLIYLILIRLWFLSKCPTLMSIDVPTNDRVCEMPVLKIIPTQFGGMISQQPTTISSNP